MPWASWLLAVVCYWAVSRVVNDPAILYFIKPHVNLERQALYGIFALLIIAPAGFGPQDQSLIRRLLRLWPMASVGVISYGIYLWHLNLIFEFLDWTGGRPGTVPFWLLALAVFALSAAVASVSYFGLERPILRVKRRMSWWDRGGKEGSPQDDGAPEGAGTGRTSDAATTVPDST
jgi:peptidoglycan/LPS O-acetylase OafA/YrhL